ncbi:MAG TPA: M15 family metallopeptidase [Microthrixaceae bacterium]|nr:M15 family metallopeptidase [Microthrixaceae bacterium]
MSRIRAGLAVLVGVAVVVLSACDGADVNEWRRAHGLPALDAQTAEQAAVFFTAIEAEVHRRATFVGEVHPVSAARLGSSWRAGCPVGPAMLRLVRVSFVGYDGSQQVGELVVHRDVAGKVVTAFRELFNDRFPIERLQTVDAFGSNDDASMAANNTSAFNCRRVAGSSSWSMHAYGKAIDVNPLTNPYVSGRNVSPPQGAPYADRAVPATGKITAGSYPVQVFARQGLRWGGYWSGAKDYQHFSTNGR